MKLKIKTKDFISLVNSGKIQIESKELHSIKRLMKLKPKKEGNKISISESNFLDEFKSTLNNHLLSVELD